MSIPTFTAPAKIEDLPRAVQQHMALIKTELDKLAFKGAIPVTNVGDLESVTGAGITLNPDAGGGKTVSVFDAESGKYRVLGVLGAVVTT